ncbi:GNAT family N-acetyltransferase [Pantoea ananatis]|uniref:GNAT family N-acetyltransferase n=1 Tax=Pantoea ananas TaxID=553 RepID=UPI0002322E94|nr:GNAT family protein [Pantoea ananatis]AER31599.1 GNAT family acetyltransferase RimL [Pantoea ananatis PA13]
MKIAESERLFIRRFLQQDAQGLLNYLSAPYPACFFDEKLADLEAAVKEARKRSIDATQFALCLQQTGNLIGHLFACDDEEPDARTRNVGWYLNPAYQGHGYAQEAAICLFNYLFRIKNVRRIYAYVADDNAGSQRLCQRLGMRLEGCFKEHVSFTDHNGIAIYENTQVYAILQREWCIS